MYVKNVNEKNKEPGVYVTATTFKASIENNMIRLFLTIGWIDELTISEISKGQIDECARTPANRVPKEIEIGLLDAVVSSVRMDNQLLLIQDRVLNLLHIYLETLEVSGFQNLTETKPYVAIRNIMKRPQLAKLYRRMSDVCEWSKNEQLDNANINRFIGDVAAQALRIEEDAEITGSITKPDEKTTKPRGRGGSGKKDRNCGKGSDSTGENRRQNVRSAHDKHANDKNSSSDTGKRPVPDWLNASCGGTHWM